MTQPQKHTPQRTCISCRREDEKEKLLRFVLAPDRTVTPDLAGRLPGRGAYTCPDPGCVRRAVEKRCFARAFKEEITADSPLDALTGFIAQLADERLKQLLVMANKAGMVVSGSDVVEKGLCLRMDGGVVWISADASRDRCEKFTYLGTRAGCMVHVGGTAAELGALLGKEQRMVLLLKPSGISSKVANELQRFRKFFDGGTQEP